MKPSSLVDAFTGQRLLNEAGLLSVTVDARKSVTVAPVNIGEKPQFQNNSGIPEQKWPPTLDTSCFIHSIACINKEVSGDW